MRASARVMMSGVSMAPRLTGRGRPWCAPTSPLGMADRDRSAVEESGASLLSLQQRIPRSNSHPFPAVRPWKWCEFDLQLQGEGRGQTE
ncbi:hypothetical protein ACFFX0_23095 [Citricoccus parietis]|uniref:Uncharacterized protein n=1 Tax=Citricoccus parietis TaxID=592307 RepID=A0ABV5G4R1_9MICC